MDDKQKTKTQLIEELAALRQQLAAAQKQATAAPPTTSYKEIADTAQAQADEKMLHFQANLLQAIEQAVIATDPQGHVIYWNRFAEQLYGYPAAEAVGKTTLELIATKDSMAHGQAIMAHLQQGKSWAGNYLARHRDGSQIPIYTTITPIYDDDDDKSFLALVAVSGHDITDRQQAEQALRKSEAQFRSAVNHIPEVFVIYDTERRYRFVNRKAEEISGLPAEQILGRTDEEIFPSEIFGAYVPLLEKAIETQATQAKRIPFHLPTGNFVTEVKYVPILDNSGKLTQILGFTYDLTAIIRTKKLLKESEAQYRLLAANLPDMDVYLFDSDMRFLIAEGALMQRGGFVPHDFEGQTLTEILNKDLLDIFLPTFQQALTGNHIRKDIFYNGYHYYHQTIPLLDEQGKITGGIALTQDITARKKTEETLREADAAKDKFLSIIAHDLKNPFISITSGTEMLNKHLQQSDDKFARTVSHELHKSSQKLFKLLENLLAWSRMEQGVVPYKPAAVDIFISANYCIKLLQESASQKQITVTSLIRAETFVFADYNMLEAILRNLISNAIKFTPTGGQVRLEATQKGEFIETAVIDTGVGIDAHKLHRLFNIGERGISSDGTDGEPGTGLGLILCKGFVKKQGGTIWVESQAGKGEQPTLYAAQSNAANVVRYALSIDR